jgi:hypothetical protein
MCHTFSDILDKPPKVTRYNPDYLPTDIGQAGGCIPTNIEYLTHKHIEETSRRVYDTLTADKSVDTQRIARILGFLIDHLNNRGLLPGLTSTRYSLK